MMMMMMMMPYYTIPNQTAVMGPSGLVLFLFFSSLFPSVAANASCRRANERL